MVYLLLYSIEWKSKLTLTHVLLAEHYEAVKINLKATLLSNFLNYRVVGKFLWEDKILCKYINPNKVVSFFDIK